MQYALGSDEVKTSDQTYYLMCINPRTQQRLGSIRKGEKEN